MRRAGLFCGLIAAALLLEAGVATAGSAPVLLTCVEALRSVDVPASTSRSDGVLLQAAAGSLPAVLVVEEAGGDIEWREPAVSDFRDLSSRPPRYGVAAWPVAHAATVVLRARDRRRAATARVALHCNPSAEIAALPLCLTLPALWSVPAVHRISPWCDALVAHGTATAAARRGENISALSAYREAAQRWSDRGDGVREGAALLGAAEILFRLDRYPSALDEARRAQRQSRASGNAYFALRAQGEICLALRELGRRDEGRNCQATLARQFAAHGEAADAANAEVNFGSMAYDDGKIDLARAALARLQALDFSQTPADAAPRVRMLAASLAMRDARIVPALAELDIAAHQFEQTGNARWLANTQLRIATTYAQLGSYDESRHFAEAALSTFATQHALARQALALRLLGTADAALGDDARAATQFAQSRRLLASTGSPAGLFSLDLAEAAARRDATALQRAWDGLDAASQASPQQRARLHLLRAWQAFREDDRVSAASSMTSVAMQDLSFADYLRARTLHARLTAADGNPRAGFALIEEDITRLHAVASAVSSPALRYLVGARLDELRAAWVDTYAQAAPAERPDAAAFWMLLQKTRRLQWLAGGTGGGSQAQAVDLTLAQLLLQAGDSDDERGTLAAQRQLLEFYLRPRARGTDAPDPTPLQHVQRGLPANTRLIAFAAGDEHWLRLSLTREGMRVDTIGTATVVSEAVRRVRNAFTTPDVPVATIQADVTALSGWLFAGETGDAPERLLILAEEDTGGIPFVLLPWPDGRVLLDTTAVSLLTGEPQPDGFLLSGPPRQIHVLSASMRGSTDPRLPSLVTAARDTDTLRQVLPHADYVVRRDAQFTREHLFDAFAVPGSWVHIAAHGSNSPRLQRYSGLWLEPSAGSKAPALVSWLELAERGVQSDLVLLSSCSLGGDPERGRSSAASFAAATSAAGARHVVAALWPVSDIAASQFSQAFYAELTSNPPLDPARAVAAAQRRLSKVAQLRHPYYWSLFVHLQR